MRIAVLPGDGIGPEVTGAAQQLLRALAPLHDAAFEFTELPVGGTSIDQHGVPLLPEVLEECRAVGRGAAGRGRRPEVGLDRSRCAAARAGPAGAPQGPRAVREPAPGARHRCAARREPAAPGAGARRRPADRARADGRDLLRRPRPARRGRARHVRLLGGGDRADRRAGLPHRGLARPPRAASSRSTRPTSSRPHGCGARRSSASRRGTRACSSSTCWSTTPRCS